MSDPTSEFEDRLGRALSHGAEHAPGPVGIADGARTRARSRRHRRVSAVAAATVLAVVLPLALVASRDGGPGEDPVTATPAGPGWQTLTFDLETYSPEDPRVTVLVDVPDSWVESSGDDETCGAYDYGAPAVTGCTEVEAVSVRADSGNLDFAFGPGLRAAGDFDWPVTGAWIGHVDISGVVVDVASDDQQVALRVLGSARLAGESIPDLAGGWPVLVGDGVSYPAPPFEETDGYGVRVSDRGDSTTSTYGEEVEQGRWRATSTVGSRRVDVVAPTQALAELIAGSARRPEAAWHTVEVAPDVLVDLPVTWVGTGSSSCDVVGTGFGPRGGVCGVRGGLFVVPVAQHDPSELPGLVGNEGYVVAGDQAISISGIDRETALRILGSARASDEPDVDAPTWAGTEIDNYTVRLPHGLDVEVRVLPGMTRCTVRRLAAAPTSDGAWRADVCEDRAIEVTGPTQAVTDLVAASIRAPG